MKNSLTYTHQVGRRMARSTIHTITSPRTIGELYIKLNEYTETELKEIYPWATRFVMGYPLPSWQRNFVWTHEQQVRFIQSIWNDIEVGSYLVNDIFKIANASNEKAFILNSDVLLDGQQRLTSLENYFKNEIALPDDQGIPCYWDELSVVDHRYFKNKVFSRSTVATFDESILRIQYDLKNFGGTAHKISERATNNFVSPEGATSSGSSLSGDNQQHVNYAQVIKMLANRKVVRFNSSDIFSIHLDAGGIVVKRPGEVDLVFNEHSAPTAWICENILHMNDAQLFPSRFVFEN